MTNTVGTGKDGDMAEKYFCFFENIRTAIKKLPRDQQLAFREAIENYVFDGVEPSDPVFAALLQILKPSLDKKGRGGQAGNKNAQKSANNSNKTNKNESKRIETNKNESNESGHETLNTKHQTLNTKGVPPTPKTNIFSPPTLDEVLAYAKQQTEMAGVGGFPCAPYVAEQFWAHYQSQGWRKSNDAETPVRDWRAALRMWARGAGPGRNNAPPSLINNDDLPI